MNELETLAETPLSHEEEMEVAAELLEIKNDQELEGFLPILLGFGARAIGGALLRRAAGRAVKALARRVVTRRVRDDRSSDRRHDHHGELEIPELESLVPALTSELGEIPGDPRLEISVRFVRLVRSAAKHAADVIAERARLGQPASPAEIQKIFIRNMLEGARQQIPSLLSSTASPRGGSKGAGGSRVATGISRKTSAVRPEMSARRLLPSGKGASPSTPLTLSRSGAARWVFDGNNLTIDLGSGGVPCRRCHGLQRRQPKLLPTKNDDRTIGAQR